MANILFYENQFTIAGTTRALLDYANANQKYLGNKAFLAFNKKVDSSFEPHWSQSSFKQAVDDSFNAVEKTFPTKLGENLEILENYIKENNIEYVYQIKSGEPDGYLFKNAKNLIHAVFPQHPNNKHGEKYAFVSQWLSEYCSNGEIPYIPHMVKTPKYNLEELKIEFRKKHNIPLDAKVFGRLGSYNEFNIEFVHEAIKQVLNKDKNIYFIFCNTRGFYDHPNISYFYPVFDNKEKYSFISACDAMIHARKRGETFGISIAEYSSCNKPIFTWSDSNEKAHLQMLGDKAIIYKDQKNLEDLMLNYKISKDFDYNSYREFSPENVIKKFENIFLNE